MLDVGDDVPKINEPGNHLSWVQTTMKRNRKNEPLDLRLVLIYGAILIAGLTLVVVGVVLAIRTDNMTLLGLGVIAVLLPAALYPIASALSIAARQAVRREDFATAIEQLRLTNDRLMFSETAKEIVYRKRQREALRQTIREEIDRGDFDSADALVEQVVRVQGDGAEAERWRSRVTAARSRCVDQHVTDAHAKFDVLLAKQDWEASHSQVCEFAHHFPDSQHTIQMTRRIDDAWHQYKHNLDRQFLEASARDDVERAMQLLRELDIYLGEGEAEPLREAARGVITKKRMNLGVQFKMAVHDKDWSAALRIGNEIIDSFSNTKMAEEVRGMKTLLEARATRPALN